MMSDNNCYMVVYRLSSEGQRNECLDERMKAYGIYWPMRSSAWIISTKETAVQVRDNLSGCLDGHGKLIVAKLSGEAAWTGHNDKVAEWLHKYLGSKGT